MRGFITNRNLDDAESCFPGIRRFYDTLNRKPATFLELVWAYETARQISGYNLSHAA